MEKHLYLLILCTLLISCSPTSIQTPTETAVPNPTNTNQPTPTTTNTPTTTPTATATTPPTATATTRPQVQLKTSATTHTGPGDNYDRDRLVKANETYIVIATDANRDWYNILFDDGQSAWVTARAVGNTSELQSITVAATIPAPPTSPPTNTPQPTNTLPPPTSPPRPTSPPPPPPTAVPPTAEPPPPAAVCSCSGDTYNCSDFNTHSQAQACFNYCLAQGAGDIHRLDRDNNNNACESLP